MSDHSSIEWTEATWNPVRGCERVSDGCKKCYAEILAARHSYPGGWGEGLAKWVTRPDGTREARWTGVLRQMPPLLDAPLHWKKPRRIFVNSMSDLFHEDVTDEFIDKVFSVMGQCDDGGTVHTFQILTKRPARMLEYVTSRGRAAWNSGRMNRSAWPARNVWLGISAEDQATFDERVEILGHIPAAVRWISAEPLLGHIDARAAMPNKLWNGIPGWNEQEIGWVVIGGESGSDPRPMNMEHARSLIEQCKASGVPVFVKQDNGHRPGMQGRFTDTEWSLKEYP